MNIKQFCNRSVILCGQNFPRRHTEINIKEEKVKFNIDDVIAEAYVQSPKKVLLLTAFRSGSTFAGELFNRNSDAFYLFEPLGTVIYVFVYL